MEETSVYIKISVVVIAACSVVATCVLYWIARNLIDGSASLKKLIETVDYNVHTTVDLLQKSISDVNEITERLSGQMEKIDGIAENAEQITSDVRSSMHVINNTVVPTLTNLQSISAGARKAIETWNDFGKENAEDEKR